MEDRFKAKRCCKARRPAQGQPTPLQSKQAALCETLHTYNRRGKLAVNGHVPARSVRTAVPKVPLRFPRNFYRFGHRALRQALFHTCLSQIPKIIPYAGASAVLRLPATMKSSYGSVAWKPTVEAKQHPPKWNRIYPHPAGAPPAAARPPSLCESNRYCCPDNTNATREAVAKRQRSVGRVRQQLNSCRRSEARLRTEDSKRLPFRRPTMNRTTLPKKSLPAAARAGKRSATVEGPPPSPLRTMPTTGKRAHAPSSLNGQKTVRRTAVLLPKVMVRPDSKRTGKSINPTPDFAGK